jgi:hypothetical protein
MTEPKFKAYEEMTPEERDARNEAAFNWDIGSLIFYPPPPGTPSTDAEHLSCDEDVDKEATN